MTESVLQFVANMRGDLTGIDRPGISRLHRRHHDSKSRNQLQLSLARGAPAQFCAPLHRVFERHDPWARSCWPWRWVCWRAPNAVPSRSGWTPSRRSPGSWVRVGKILPYVIVTVVFTFMYSFIPNTKVELRAALIGGVTCRHHLGAGRQGVHGLHRVFLVAWSAVYTGFAIVLTTLIWVYLSWLILLIGAQLAFYLQFPQYLRHGQASVRTDGKGPRAGRAVDHVPDRPRLRGRQDASGSATSLAAELDIPSIALAPVLHCLEETGLIVGHRTRTVRAGPRSLNEHQARGDFRRRCARCTAADWPSPSAASAPQSRSLNAGRSRSMRRAFEGPSLEGFHRGPIASHIIRRRWSFPAAKSIRRARRRACRCHRRRRDPGEHRA